jgi:hypothetical protein
MSHLRAVQITLFLREWVSPQTIELAGLWSQARGHDGCTIFTFATLVQVQRFQMFIFFSLGVALIELARRILPFSRMSAP